MGGGGGGGCLAIYSAAPATATQISSLQRRTPFFADAKRLSSRIGPLAAPSLQTRLSPAAIRRRSTEPLIEQISNAVVANAAPSLLDVEVSPARG